MAKKKKTKKSASKPKKSAARKPARRKASLKKATSKKKTPVKKPTRKKAVIAKKAKRKSTPRKVTAPPKPQRLDTAEIDREQKRARAGVLSGDLQGFSRKGRADSESVDELLREGNAYEAGIQQGVEEADDADESEVMSHEVLADDVPKEYLDKD